MTFLRRNWAILLAFILTPLVVLLAVLQLNWIRDMGERERFRLRQGLFVAAGELASAFQKEILLAPWALAPPPFTGSSPVKPGERAMNQVVPRREFSAALGSGNWSFLTERWQSWVNYALDPSIIDGIHLIDARSSSSTKVMTWNGSAFSPEADGELTAKIVTRLVDRDASVEAAAPEKRPRYLRFADEEWNIVPIPLEPGLLLLLRYDIRILAERVLPRLAELHLGDMSDYRFKISERSSGKLLYLSDQRGGDEGFDQADIRLGLFRLNFINPDAAAKNPSAASLPGDTMVFMLRSNRNPQNLRGGDDAMNSPDRQTDALWLLEAVHRRGSLTSVVRESTFRSAAASTGILLILGISLFVLALSNRRAQALGARQEEFVASVTHELKTPLAVIGSAAENLADGIIRDDAGLARYGSTIGIEAKRLATMIDKLLLYTRLGASQIAGRDDVDLCSLAKTVLAERGAELSALEFQIELVLPEEPLIVRGDETSLRHAAANLVSNVIVHAAEGRYIGVFVEARTMAGRKGEICQAQLRVVDHGPGIPRRERKAVFEAFFRGRRAREAQEPGSGIGLDLVKKVAHAHGGSVVLESTEGSGTTVAILLRLEAKGGDHG